MSKLYGVLEAPPKAPVEREADAINGICSHLFGAGIGVRVIGGLAKVIGGPASGDALTFNLFVTPGTNHLGTEQLFATVTMLDGKIAVIQHSQIWGTSCQLSPPCDQKGVSP